MRHLVRAFYLLSLFTLAGLAQAADSPKQIVDDYMAAWNAHDADKAAGYLADDAEYFDVTVGTPQKGREAARDNVIKVFVGAVPDLKWKMTGEPIVGEDGISFQWNFSGTNTGDWDPKTPATNKPLSFDGVSFIKIKDGKIVYQGDYYDALGLHKQLGW
ncbi:ester cyclase [Pseudomonas schmalbachii]|uniref:Nuclear transport factor 2 family protein n=1 Tax=Pseudomonas schmalbachii TaxID=2816993 RepID=A0ABS3TYP2_9PSED|nr:nuclear transport factor 2 family protein [Pseudomonas schmalbachii]MBO3277739.1 nuclear transport factor 2 family protein [Pseudomonas schmalbachii]